MATTDIQVRSGFRCFGSEMQPRSSMRRSASQLPEPEAEAGASESRIRRRRLTSKQPTAGPYPSDAPTTSYERQRTTRPAPDPCRPCPPPVTSAGKRYYLVRQVKGRCWEGETVIAIGAVTAETLQGGCWGRSTGFANLEDAVNAAAKKRFTSIQLVWQP